jgi:hypothetical protein
LTSAVFGDFLGAGRKHLEAAVAEEDGQVAFLPAVVPPLHRLVTIMSLYVEDLAPCDQIEAAGRTDLHVWERAVIDTGAALRIAADCLHRSVADLSPGEPASEPAPSRARHLADAATELVAGRDLLDTHIVPGPDGLAQERSEWAPVVTSLPVTRALANEIAVWSVRLAPFTAWLAGLATPQVPRRSADQPFVLSPREELASASQWLRAAGAALRPALDADPVRAVDAELLHAIPAVFPPPRRPLGSAAESIAELCDGITVSASRLRASVHRGRDRVSWSPDVTSGGWQWMAQAAAVTSHLSELALRSLATRAGQLHSVPVTEARLHGAADSMVGMRAAWQRVDLMWNTIITEQRLLPTLTMSEAGDLLLRMGRLVWDNPQWTPARAGRGPRRNPAALRPGPPRSPPSWLPHTRRPMRWRALPPPTSPPWRPLPAPDGSICRPGHCPRSTTYLARSRPRWSARSWICRRPTAVLPEPVRRRRESWTRSPSRWQRPVRSWPWHGWRQWRRRGDGAVKAPGPMTTVATVCRVPMCLSEIAVQAPGCPGRWSGPSGNVGFMTR